MESKLVREDLELIVALGSSASLDRSPKKNWVEKAGGLPPFVREVAREVEKSGHSLDSAIAIAIGSIKKWAAKGNVKAIKALAQWEALKAKSKAKSVAASNSEVAFLLTTTQRIALSYGVDPSDLDLVERHGRLGSYLDKFMTIG